jgi:hypothetical protein
MDSNLRRFSGRFAGIAVRTLLGFSLLAGCITTAVAQGNASNRKANGTSLGATLANSDAPNQFKFSITLIGEAK